MRLDEITAIKPIKPRTPCSARINALKQAKAVAGLQKAQQTFIKARIG